MVCKCVCHSRPHLPLSPCHACHSHWLYAAIKLKILNIIVSEKLAPSCPAAVEQTEWGGGEEASCSPVPRRSWRAPETLPATFCWHPRPVTPFPGATAADNIAGIAGTQSQSRKPKAIYARSHSSLSVFCELRKDNANCCCSQFSHLIVWIFTEFTVWNCLGSGKFVQQKIYK